MKDSDVILELIKHLLTDVVKDDNINWYTVHPDDVEELGNLLTLLLPAYWQDDGWSEFKRHVRLPLGDSERKNTRLLYNNNDVDGKRKGMWDYDHFELSNFFDE